MIVGGVARAATPPAAFGEDLPSKEALFGDICGLLIEQ